MNVQNTSRRQTPSLMVIAYCDNRLFEAHVRFHLVSITLESRKKVG